MTKREIDTGDDVADAYATRIESGETTRSAEALTVEAPLHIRVNGEAFTTTMRTPGQDEALARGLLFTEGIVVNPECRMEFACVDDPETGLVAALEMTVPGEDIAQEFAGRRSLMASSSCGMCGMTELRDIEIYGPPIALNPGSAIPYEAVPVMMETMREAQSNFAHTGGCHAAAVFDAGQNLLTVQEDIGRHNAVDKCIGTLLAAGTIGEAHTMTVSGRMSYEIIFKAYKAGVPVLAAVSAPSSMAVDTADRLGQTVIGFCRDNRLTVYTYPERLTGLE